MSDNRKVYYFVARQWKDIEENTQYTIVIPENGQITNVPERAITDNQLKLGDFFYVKEDQLKKTAYLRSTVVENVAYIKNMKSKLVEISGQLIFQNNIFSDSICHNKTLPLGDYTVTISLLPKPIQISSGVSIYFEASEVKPLQEEQQMKEKIGPSEPLEEKVKETPKKKKNIQKTEKLRAVVMDYEIKNGVRTHFLWILEKQAEGIFSSQTHELAKGHFFTGTFQFQKNKQWKCESYEQGIEKPLIQGGLDEKGNIFFKVEVEKFKEAGLNMRFSTAQVKYIGEILDMENKLKDEKVKNGKTVKIKRIRIEQLDVHVWSILEVL